MDSCLPRWKWAQAICIVMLLLSINSSAQADSVLSKNGKFKLGLSFLVGYTHRDDTRLFPEPALTLQNSRHLFSLGYVGNIKYSEHKNEGAGVEFSYQYYPNSKQKVVKLCLIATTSYLSNHYSETGFKGQINTIQSRDYKAAAGFGVRINLSRFVYFYEQNAFGVDYSITNNSYNYYPSGHTNSYADAYPYGYFQLWAGFGLIISNAPATAGTSR